MRCRCNFFYEVIRIALYKETKETHYLLELRVCRAEIFLKI